MQLSEKPSESLVKVTFYGIFTPSSFGAIWLVQNGLIDASESRNAKDLNKADSYCRFMYNFVTIIVKPDNMAIGVSDYHAVDFLLDFSKSIFSVIRQSVNHRMFSLATNFHYKLERKKIESILEEFQNKTIWRSVFQDKTNLEGVVVSSNSSLRGLEINTRINLAKCQRPDMEDNIHVFVSYSAYPVPITKAEDIHLKKTFQEPKIKYLSYDKQVNKMLSKTESIVEFFISSVFNG